MNDDDELEIALSPPYDDELDDPNIGKSFFQSLPVWLGALDLTPGSTGLKLFDKYCEIRRHSFPDHEGRPGQVGGSLPRGEGGNSSPSNSVTLTNRIKQSTRVSAIDRVDFDKAISSAIDKMPNHIAEGLNDVVKHIGLDNDTKSHYAASYGGGSLSVNMARFEGGRAYKTWDHVYKEDVTHGLQDAVYHELGHAAEAVLASNKVLRQSWRDTVGLATGEELEVKGVKKIMTPLPPELSKRREFKKGGEYDWNTLGWTYEGYRRLTSVVYYDKDSAGRLRNVQGFLPTSKSTYVKDTFKPPTSYAGSNARELFADSFMLYHHNPDKLKQRSPEIYDWMDKWHKST